MRSEASEVESPELLARFGGSAAGSVSGPCGDLRSVALALALIGLDAADPGAATRRCVSYDTAIDTIQVDGVGYPLSAGAKVWVIGAGKASYPIAAVLEEILGDRIAGGVIAVRDPDVESAAPRARCCLGPSVAHVPQCQGCRRDLGGS